MYTYNRKEITGEEKMSALLICLIIAVSIVYVTDCLNAINNIGGEIVRIITRGKITELRFRLKILNCSLCQTFWITLIVLLVLAPEFCFMSLVYAAITPYILCVLQAIDNLLRTIFLAIEKGLDLIKKKL